jgi:hypothetical protein
MARRACEREHAQVEFYSIVATLAAWRRPERNLWPTE